MHFTKMLSVCCAILFGAFMATDLNAQCLTASEGQFPGTTFTPACDQSTESISDFAWTDEYSVVEVSVGTEYTFASSVSTHLITISADDGATAAASGTGSVTWTAPAGGTVRFYTHLSSACDGEQVSHTRSVSCALASCPDGSFPGDTCDDGDPTTIDDTVQEDCGCVGIPAAENDTPCTATALACGDTLLDQSILGATAFGTDDCFGSATADVYYSFTADGTQTYRVAVLDPAFAFDGVVELLEGPDCNSLTVVGACDDFPEEFTVTEAGNYYFRVRAFNSTETDGFNITLECIPFDCPGVGNIGDSCDDGEAGTVDDVIQEDCSCAGTAVATNDTPCTATALACGDTLQDQSLAGATAFGTDDCFGTGTADVYYSFTADGSQTYRIAVLDPAFAFDGVVELLEGSDCNDLAVVGACDDFPEEFTVTDAGEYYFRVRAFSSIETDGFDITIECIPFDCPGLGNIGESCDDGEAGTINDQIQEDCSCAGTPVVSNDTPCTATALACNDTTADQSLAGATAFGTDECSGSGTADVYYSFTADGSTTYTVSVIDINGTFFDGVVELLEGPDCESLTVSQGCSDFPETYEVTAAGNYVLRVRAFSSFEVDGFAVALECSGIDCPGLGNFGDSCDDGNPNTSGETVQEDCSCGGGIEVPANDNCDGAITLACGDTIAGTTEGANSATNAPSGCGFTPGDTFDVWYAFEADGTSDYIVSVAAGATSTAWDGVLYVYSGACDGLTEVTCSDNTVGGGTEVAELLAPEAGTYYVQFYDFGGTDTYEVSLECISNCAEPFPAVDEASLSTTFLGTSYLVEWDAVEGQIGCQVQFRFANTGPNIKKSIIEGEDANSAIIPGFLLDFNTDYEWRVRCGCSADPLIVGPASSWQPFSTPGSVEISSQPNPTEGLSNVSFTVIEEGYTTLEVYDMSGRLVDAIFTGNTQPNNEYRFEFDGSALPNGVYMYRLTTESEVLVEKFMIAK